jgi:methylmalonyl-CoA mutase
MAVDETAKRPFANASHAQWQEQLGKTLGGKTSADLTWTTGDKQQIEALHVQEDLAQLPHIASGAVGLLRKPRARAIRQLIDSATPAMARQLVEQSLERGADELLIRLDRLGRAGIDPLTFDPGWEDFELYDHDAGTDGCSIYHLQALTSVLGPVDLTKTTVAFDAGAASIPLLCMLLRIATQQGIDPQLLRIELGLDPIHELTCGAPVGSTHETLLDEISIACGNTASFPSFIPIAVHSAGLHNAGASPAVELGYSIATGIEYVRHLLANESSIGVDADTACASLCFRFPVNTELFVEVAKLRAARLLWAKVAQSFGASSGQTTIHAESSLRPRAANDTHTNLLRTGIQGFAATLANCDSITLAPFERSYDSSAQFAHALARNQQILLREEAHMHRVHDATGGSYSIETMTDAIGQEAWDFVKEVEAAGGIMQALRSGMVQRRVHSTAEQRRDDFRCRRRTLVGINRFVDPKTSANDSPPPDIHKIREDLDEYLRQRDEDAIATLLDQEIIDSVEAVAAGCTLGEMVAILRGELDLSLVDPFLAMGSDGESFEQLRDLVADCKLTVLPILAGNPNWSRARHEYALEYFTVGGFEVLPCHQQIDATAILGQQPDYVVLCSDDANYPSLIPQLPAGVKVIVAGIPQPEILDSVSAFIHKDDNAYLTLRNLFLVASEDARPNEGEDE